MQVNCPPPPNFELVLAPKSVRPIASPESKQESRLDTIRELEELDG